MPLVIAPLNQNLRIIKVLVDQKLKKHLESLGIVVNETVNILSKSNGSVVLVIKEGRIALDKNIATKILVA
ncbi:MAG: ferrous iron transport protein A [Bacilli bacterium]|nr:ferrous iron transport protein A [Bacilli bacterium]